MDSKVEVPAGARRKKPVITDKQFLELDELLYAPLGALSHSNMQLHSSAIDAIRSMGTVKQIGPEEVIYLNSLNIAYNQLKSQPDEGCSLETLQMKVPLLSLIPVSNLNIEKAELDFSTEIQITDDPEDGQKIKARICAPEQRETDFLPKVTYKMKVRSISPLEGLLRITDLLNSAPVAKRLDSIPLSPEGAARDEQFNQLAKQREKLKNQEKKLNALYQRIEEAMESQEKLQELSGCEERADGFQFDREKYKGLQEKIMEDLMRLKEQILKLEIRLTEEDMG